MCAEYTLRTSKRDLSQLLEVSVLNLTEHEQWDLHARLYAKTPILLTRDGKITLEEMHFSLLPRGGRIPFTANTRLDDWDDRKNKVTYAFERPTWKEAFLRHRCVVPMSEFLEPIYFGDYAGQMIAFFDEKHPLLFAAGIYQETLDTKTGEVFTGFSLLTDYARPFVREIGHSRTVIMLPEEAALKWIEEKPITGPDGVRFLLENKQDLDLSLKSARTMKNWKARAAANIEKFQAEEKTRERVEATRHG